MSIQDERDLESLRAIGRIVRQILDAMKAGAGPGVSTRHLDEIGARVMKENGARSAPQMVYHFPGATCISLNDEAVHGIPSDRQLKEGDLVFIDKECQLARFLKVHLGCEHGDGLQAIDIISGHMSCADGE